MPTDDTRDEQPATRNNHVAPRSSDNQADTLEDRHEREKKTHTSKSRLEVLSLVFDGAIVLFTLVLTIVSYYQWRVARESIEIANRAWVTIEDAQFNEIPTVGKSVEVTIRGVNSGNTPAMNVRNVVILLMDSRLPDAAQVKAPTNAISSGVVAASGEFFVTVSTSQPVADAHLKLLASGSQRIYVFGSVIYGDIFDRQHTSQFCYMSGRGGSTGKVLDVCPQGNGAN